jgi:hypothetical protein
MLIFAEELRGGQPCQEVMMLRLVATGAAAALFATVSSLSFAQSASPGMQKMQGVQQRMQGMQRGSGASDWDTLTDTRINIIKSALQLTPDQEKHWPAIEKAIRTRAEHRQTRIANAAQAMAEKKSEGMIDAWRDRDPIQFMNKHAVALSQRADDLKQLADAWQPLYQTLKPDQKRRLALLSIAVLRVMGNAAEQRRWEVEEDSED